MKRVSLVLLAVVVVCHLVNARPLNASCGQRSAIEEDKRATPAETLPSDLATHQLIAVMGLAGVLGWGGFVVSVQRFDHP